MRTVTMCFIYRCSGTHSGTLYRGYRTKSTSDNQEAEKLENRIETLKQISVKEQAAGTIVDYSKAAPIRSRWSRKRLDCSCPP
ncbi:unnamed protein product [Caenorhabditis nigoni]